MAQPNPLTGKTDVTPEALTVFMDMLNKREKEGIATYGTTLQTFNGRDALQDLMEELVDAFQYAVQLKLEAEELQVWCVGRKSKKNDNFMLHSVHLTRESAEHTAAYLTKDNDKGWEFFAARFYVCGRGQSL